MQATASSPHPETPSGLRGSLLAVPRSERPAPLLRQLRRRVADLLGTAPASVPTDRPYPEISPQLRSATAIYAALREIVLTDLGIRIYPNEIAAHPTLRLLAGYLAGEIEGELPEPPAAPFDDLYAGGSWSWGAPEVPPEDRPRNPTVLFVLSAPRSGSTLFRTMLAGHPALFAPPELNLLPFPRMAERGRLIDRLGYPWMRSGPGTVFAELEGLSLAETEQRLLRLERENVDVPDLYRAIQERAAPRLLVDKSPLYAMHPGWLSRAEALFERPRYVFLVRHPFSVMESFVRMRFHRLLGPHWLVWDEHPWVLAEKAWTSANRHILEFLDAIKPQRRRALRYEELVTDPAAALGGVCELLGIPFDDALLRPYEGERMTRHRGLPSAHTVGDPNLLQRDRVDPSLARAWERVRPPHPISPLTRETAAALGYELPAG